MNGDESVLDRDMDMDDVEGDSQKDKYLTFAVSNEHYGVEIFHVIEIIRVPTITEVPDVPPYIRGVINLRGRVIPIVDVRTRFRLEPREYDNRTCIVVVKIRDMPVGLVVDVVLEVATILPEEIAPRPAPTAQESNRYIKGLGRSGDGVRILLDVDRLLFADDLTALAGGGGPVESGHEQAEDR